MSDWKGGVRDSIPARDQERENEKEGLFETLNPAIFVFFLLSPILSILRLKLFGQVPPVRPEPASLVSEQASRGGGGGG